MAFKHITTLAADAAARVLSQYQSAPKFMAKIRGVVGEVQEVEDALWDIVPQLDKDIAQGAWLDNLGNFVNEARAGVSDTDYRRFINARIAANRSQGTAEDLITVTKIVTGLSVFSLRRCTPASVEIILDGYAMAEPVLTRLPRLLGATHAAGVAVMVLYAVDATDANMALCSDDDTLQTSTTQGCSDTDLNDPSVGGKAADATRAETRNTFPV